MQNLTLIYAFCTWDSIQNSVQFVPLTFIKLWLCVGPRRINPLFLSILVLLCVSLSE
jgi:hypothetical protein